ncbi:geranylgeranyl diphosphate reductase, chloroplastic-like [Iris pallida]|uniref:Geranylgeranyl diphosphate reductase, chloroplastic-like n=1 Tax=Iris pallida TaxID=29817 RepID=A0AAX6F7H3_IRIPA|nr:geranylgeranyl diphosphate reductase, chloroplastic-like [Iris pallida]
MFAEARASAAEAPAGPPPTTATRRALLLLLLALTAKRRAFGEGWCLAVSNWWQGWWRRIDAIAARSEKLMFSVTNSRVHY